MLVADIAYLFSKDLYSIYALVGRKTYIHDPLPIVLCCWRPLNRPLARLGRVTTLLSTAALNILYGLTWSSNIMSLYGVKAEGCVPAEATAASKVATAQAAAKEVVETLSILLDRPFKARESSFWGDYRLADGTTSVRVVSQPDYRVDKILEEEFEDYHVLIYVEGPSISGINGLATPQGVVEVLRES